MENSEEVLAELIRFGSAFPERAETIPPLLDTYLQYVARSGDSLFPWQRVTPLLKAKLDRVIDAFSAEVPADKVPVMPNVEPFQFTQLRLELHLAIDNMGGTPFTIQRLCELVTDPHRYYKRVDKYMRGVEKNVRVVSVIDPRQKPTGGVNGDRLGGDSAVNAVQSNGSTSSQSPGDHSSGDVTSSMSPSDDVYASPHHSPPSELPGVDSVLNAMSDSSVTANIDRNITNNNSDSSDTDFINSHDRVSNTDTGSSSNTDMSPMPDSNESAEDGAVVSRDVASLSGSDPAVVDNSDALATNSGGGELRGVENSCPSSSSFSDVDSTSSSAAVTDVSTHSENRTHAGLEPGSVTSGGGHDQCGSGSLIGESDQDVEPSHLPAAVSPTVGTTSDLSIVAMDIECSAVLTTAATPSESVSSQPEVGVVEPVFPAPESLAPTEPAPSVGPVIAEPEQVADISVDSDMSLDDSLHTADDNDADLTNSAQQQQQEQKQDGTAGEVAVPVSMQVEEAGPSSNEAISTSSEPLSTASMEVIEQSEAGSDDNSNNNDMTSSTDTSDVIKYV